MKKKRKQYTTVRPDRSEEPRFALAGESVQVGDFVSRHPVTFDTRDGRPVHGRVVWVHPAGRFHVVEFEKGVRESFMGVQR